MINGSNESNDRSCFYEVMFLLVSYDLNVTVMPLLAWKVGSSTGSFHFEPENR